MDKENDPHNDHIFQDLPPFGSGRLANHTKQNPFQWLSNTFEIITPYILSHDHSTTKVDFRTSPVNMFSKVGRALMLLYQC